MERKPRESEGILDATATSQADMRERKQETQAEDEEREVELS